MSGLDLDAIDAAGAALTCCRSRCSICGRKSWCGGHAMGDSACTRPGAVECRAVATVRRLRTDLAAARAEADALRGLVGEACAYVDEVAGWIATDGYGGTSRSMREKADDIRARAEKGGSNA